MKITSAVLAFCMVWGSTTGFSINNNLAPRVATTRLATIEDATGTDYLDMFPQEIAMQRIEGGGTVRTYQMPVDADRCQYVLKSEGRPLKAVVELWLGPLRRTHIMDISVEDGAKTPYRATLKFKPGGPQVLRIRSTDKKFHLPLSAGVYVPDKERRAELRANTESLFDRVPKQKIQGNNVGGGGSAVRLFPIDNYVEAVQVLFWAVNTGKKSLKATIEVLQGPNNVKQVYQLHAGGGSQPYHGVIETPGDGVVLRITNRKFVEDGLFEAAVVPYKYSYASRPGSTGGAMKEWWQ
ncbi:expressed unknown protein [Seminavis robusta]|uniref:Uncharacterized protein n=1 Tax=Seminavis robusta TaxID=568900 RepID=A0A9N8DHC7_9STRA|nr:expressed unknown protein [Seminavis robusta]|eukprot:Sro91_g047740.1 n/a (295) ;mRNA; r:67835-68719